MKHVAYSMLAVIFSVALPARLDASVPGPFSSVQGQFRSSPIPVFIPMWLPTFTTRTYPHFEIVRGMQGYGPGYILTLFDNPTYQDHASTVFWVTGEGGDDLRVTSHTQPVWLGRVGWAYIDPHVGSNAGYTISVVKAIGTGFLAPEYTYEIGGSCGAITESRAQLFQCYEHAISSLQRYIIPRSAASSAIYRADTRVCPHPRGAILSACLSETSTL